MRCLAFPFRKQEIHDDEPHPQGYPGEPSTVELDALIRHEEQHQGQIAQGDGQRPLLIHVDDEDHDRDDPDNRVVVTREEELRTLPRNTRPHVKYEIQHMTPAIEGNAHEPFAKSHEVRRGAETWLRR